MRRPLDIDSHLVVAEHVSNHTNDKQDACTGASLS